MISLNSSFEDSEILSSSPKDSSPIMSKIGSSSNSAIYAISTDPRIVYKTVNHCSQINHSSECSHLLNESDILQKCHHPNIISLIQQYQGSSSIHSSSSSFKRKSDCCYIILEKASCDLLAQLSSIFPKVLELSYIKYCFNKIAGALSFLHSEMKIAHNDIKLENILLFGSEPKLADFGFASKHQGNPIKQAMSYLHRSKKNLAPEINFNLSQLLKYQKEQLHNFQAFDERKSDAFAFGVALFNALFHCNPFDKLAEKHDKIYSLLGSENFWQTIPQISRMLQFLEEQFKGSNIPQLKNLLEGLLNPNPSKRMSLLEAVNYPWFSLV